ncbi:MAG: AAA family ATPase [Desulfobacterales bacterium]|jgi:Type II secretory pathway, component ExeA (predicted ATPase)
MFEQFYGFAKTPFGRDLETNELYETQGYLELVARMKYVAGKKQFGLFTGEVGSGKSTAARVLTAQLNPAKYQVLYISDSKLTPRNFYWEALHQLGQEPKFYRGDAKRQLHRVIMDLHDNQRKTPVIIIDEGHLLGKEMLEEIRFLTNFRMDSYSPMSLILLGQPELRRILQMQIYEAITQRVNLRFHLSGMELEETRGYIAHHLKIAGVQNALFTENAVEVIHEYSGGIARKINNVCTACLLDAFARRKSLVDDHMVRVVLENEFMV